MLFYLSIYLKLRTFGYYCCVGNMVSERKRKQNTAPT